MAEILHGPMATMPLHSSTLPTDLGTPSLIGSGYSFLAETATSALGLIPAQASEAVNSLYQYTTELVPESARGLYDSVTANGVVSTLWAYTPEYVKSTAYTVSSRVIGERQANTLIQGAEAFWSAESGEGLGVVTKVILNQYAPELNVLDVVYQTIGSYYDSAKRSVEVYLSSSVDPVDSVNIINVAAETPETTPTAVTASNQPNVAQPASSQKGSNPKPVQTIIVNHLPEVVLPEAVSLPLSFTLVEDIPTPKPKSHSSDSASSPSHASRVSQVSSPATNDVGGGTVVSYVGELNSAEIVITDGSQVVLSTTANLVFEKSDDGEKINVVAEVPVVAESDQVWFEGLLKLGGQNLQTVHVPTGARSSNPKHNPNLIPLVSVADFAGNQALKPDLIEFESNRNSINGTRTLNNGDRVATGAEWEIALPQSEVELGLANASDFFSARYYVDVDSLPTAYFPSSAIGQSLRQYAQVPSTQLSAVMLLNVAGFAGRIFRIAYSDSDKGVNEGLMVAALNRINQVVTRNGMTNSDSHPGSGQEESQSEQNLLRDDRLQQGSYPPRDVSISFV